MIKRRFYKQEHDEKNDPSDSSSSSSDSEADDVPEEYEEETAEEVEAVADVKEHHKPDFPEFGSGYESEESSANEVDVDPSGLLANDDEEGTQSLGERRSNAEGDAGTVDTQSNGMEEKDSTEADYYILQCKSVFKCRLCPRIVCLTEDTLRAHLKSKRHARSEKLLREGRLKFMLNSDGEIEEDQETHAERHARTVALAENLANPKKKNKGRQRQRLRLRKKKINDGSNSGKEKQSMKNPTKKRRINKD
ncbi:uncharacterized protein LOC122094348 [Macadamia integrifolia]|uniref:uncharacterized protein LOC122094348 n=1 Tax=Macadamia integrifolia TaxID=60698 RepID=UPI001C5305D0|nr:uncharacterized protein LOC122094348 [Macadamia integrifolia]XP_042521050.1 uncharacterized protein LOC122094348 [Macadamia integrifolia]XP_042521051.1 uncharacterized protein LOC122094348 [Macadamia integrifolia]